MRCRLPPDHQLRGRLAAVIAAIVAMVGLAAPALAACPAPLGRPGTTTDWLLPFDRSAFPYDGTVPDTGEPFLNVNRNGRIGRRSPRGQFWLDTTYADRRVLLSIPAGFDPRRPAVIVVYFHGNGTTLARDVVNRQAIPDQLARSGLNAVLIAPQLASDAMDSAAGHFWDRGFFAAFLRESADKLAACMSKPRLAAMFNTLPVIVVGYSGGYNPAAAVLRAGGADDRIAGVALFDALFAEQRTFADWIARTPGKLFVMAYGSTRAASLAFRRQLAGSGIGSSLGLPARLPRGGVVFVDAGDAPHLGFMTRAWTGRPLADLLARWPAPR